MDNYLEIAFSRPEVKVLMEMLKIGNIETYDHSISVAMYVDKMLEEMDYSEEEKLEIVTGALLHDIGKLFVPFNLTQMPTTLSKVEFDIVKVHAAVSYEITKTVFSKIVSDICLYHHERPNGKGYLNGFALSDIPTEVLIVQVADVYDALTGKRRYKSKYSTNEAFEIMDKEARNLMLDDQFVRILKKVVEKNKGE